MRILRTIVSKTSFASLPVAVLLGAGSAFALIGFPATPEDLKGMASLVCSGAIVRLGRGADQAAILLTNGHCATNKSIESDDALVGIPYERGPISIFMGGDTPEEVTPSHVLYATRTGTDLALIALKNTYRELEEKGAKIYELSDVDGKPGNEVQMISGFWKEKQLCTISHIVPHLLEDIWTTDQSFALGDPCLTKGGWSGTPLVDPTSLKIIGILSTSNTNGGLCDLDNPCEVDEAGNRLAFNGRSYGQRTSLIFDCLTAKGELNLGAERCKLTKPKPPAKAKVGNESAEAIQSPKATKSGSLWPKSTSKLNVKTEV